MILNDLCTCGLILYVMLVVKYSNHIVRLTLRPPHLILNPGGALAYCPHQNFTDTPHSLIFSVMFTILPVYTHERVINYQRRRDTIDSRHNVLVARYWYDYHDGRGLVLQPQRHVTSGLVPHLSDREIDCVIRNTRKSGALPRCLFLHVCRYFVNVLIALISSCFVLPFRPKGVVTMLDALKKDPWPRSHYDVIKHYYAQYDRQIASGEYQPFLYPWGTVGAVGVIVYLLIPHHNRPWLKKGRFLVFAWITGFAIYTMLYTRAKGMAPAFGVGLISAWSVAWCSAILVCNDCQTDFQRIERLEGVFGSSRQPSLQEKNKTSSITSREEVHDNMTNGTSGPSHRHGPFAWQPYPFTPFIERLDWVLDIFSNFRGAGWNWRTSALPPPPKSIQEQLLRNSSPCSPPPKSSNRIHASQMKSYTSRQELFRANIWTFLTGYIFLDLLKTLLMHDPYFYSPLSSPSLPPPPFYPTSPILIHITRLTLSMLSIRVALGTIFSLGPLFFCFILGPSLLGARAEPFMYPDAWAPYTIVLDKGLAGWWGGWWHQTFRFAFAEPGRRIVESYGLEKRSAGAKAVQVVIAFGMSGIVHACGSFTSAGETRPLHDPMAFFILQALGVMAESLTLRPLLDQARLPRWVKRTVTFTYVHIWFYFTAHLLCNDFARGGVWLFEPTPLSPFRGLGFGADARDGWWCWGGVSRVFRWHRGSSLLGSGLAF